MLLNKQQLCINNLNSDYIYITFLSKNKKK